MNGFERISLALKGEMPDKRPVMLHNFMLAAQELGISMKQYRESPEIAAKCHIEFVEKYKVDGILFDVDTALLAGAIGIPVDFPENEPARTHKPLLEKIEDVDSLLQIDISKNIRIQHSVETIKILKKYFGNEVFIRGNCDQAPFSLACSIRTPSAFMMDLMLNEEESIRLLNYSSSVCEQFIKLMASAGSHMVSNGDSPAGPSMISPEMYQQFAMPYEKKMIDTAHEMKIPYLLHICGNTDLILDQMSTMDLDGIELDYKTPIERIYTFFGTKTCLFGTIDPSAVISLGTQQMVIDKTEEILKIYKGNPRLVIGAGCAIPNMTPEENIRTLLKTVNDYPLY